MNIEIATMTLIQKNEFRKGAERPPHCKMNQNNLAWFERLCNDQKTYMWIGILRELPVGSYVGYIGHKRYLRNRIGTKISCNKRSMDVLIDKKGIIIKLTDLICDEIYESERVIAAMNNEEFCPLPF